MPLMQRLSYLARQPHKLLHKRKGSFLQNGLLSVCDNNKGNSASLLIFNTAVVENPEALEQI